MNAVAILQQAKQLFATHREWLGEGGLPAKTAGWRAAICAGCKHNEVKPFAELFKGAVAETIKAQLELRSKLKWEHTPEVDAKLHICNLCGCVLKLKTFVPLEVARRNTPDWQSFPDFCWLKREAPAEAEATRPKP